MKNIRFSLTLADIAFFDKFLDAIAHSLK